MTRRVSRRLILMGCGAAAAALACGDDGGDDPTTTGQGGGATAGGGGSASAGGSSAGGMHGGGGMGAICGSMLVAKGSNYASDPHDLTIPVADIEAGVTKTYETTGTHHTHDVTLTDADFEALRNGETVYKYVCYNNAGSTDHEWVISCADPGVMPTHEGEIGTPGNCPAA